MTSTVGLVCFRDGTRKTYTSTSGASLPLAPVAAASLSRVTDDSTEPRPTLEWFPAGFPDSRRKVFGDDAIACSDLPPFDPKPYSLAMFILVLVFGAGVVGLVAFMIFRKKGQ